MILQYFLILFSSIFSLTIASHFLGGSFTYRHVQQPIDYKKYKSILVEIRFHISDHYFICTPEQVNDHMIVYLIGEAVPYDSKNNTYLWYETEAIRKNKNYYNIECSSQSNNHACKNFQEKSWAYCESTNGKSGYSILRRQFLLIIDRFELIQLYYSSCCWANSTDKKFHFHLSIETQFSRINSSPYPHIPASYYVDLNKPRDIQIFVYDADGDEIVCEQYKEDKNKFLTVHVDNGCKLSYENNRLGKQFGQFWLMDRHKTQILSRSLISIQVDVLKDVICNTQPELIIKTKANDFNTSSIKIKQSIDISVSLNPKCLLIAPQDQTITELTTLCANNQPIALANGGIEVLFKCTPSLCEKYEVCFVGEFTLKLPSTNIQCMSIEVTGTKDECLVAANNYDFLKPRNRHFIISEPVTQKQIARLSSTSISMRTTTTALLAAKPQSRRWLWILAAILFFLVIGYIGLKQILLRFRQRSVKSGQYRSSHRSTSSITTAPNMNPRSATTKQIYTAVPLHKQDDHGTDAPLKIKSRTQHLRQGGLFDDDL